LLDNSASWADFGGKVAWLFHVWQDEALGSGLSRHLIIQLGYTERGFDQFYILII
jgi:hypothetical protein